MNTVGTFTCEGRVGRPMQTHSGRIFFPLDPRHDEVDIGDIAHALACIPRFNGHSSEPYSVALHSVHVARIVSRKRPELALAALLHDATEAYLGDIVRPLKLGMSIDGVPIQQIEARLEVVILEALGVPVPSAEDRAIIREADNIALATEARDLMGNPRWDGLPEPDELAVFHFDGFSGAEQFFLWWFERLGGTR